MQHSNQITETYDELRQSICRHNAKYMGFLLTKFSSENEELFEEKRTTKGRQPVKVSRIANSNTIRNGEKKQIRLRANLQLLLVEAAQRRRQSSFSQGKKLFRKRQATP
ncbi:hypothetical protein MAR_007926 [Mya arenaria]|uniref:Uncharacterized protein n=1 Tax=Mya arenaria TaxID=6604 RepID=A0ABY7DUI4_MYAAR|nr:hypothetical protein MAR_007926 [Mya arenaria]